VTIELTGDHEYAHLHDTKSEFLSARDWALMATAIKYDVSRTAGRKASVDDLSALFFSLADAVGADLFIEAGAKDGSSATYARAHLGVDRAVAFEANPYTYRRFASRHSPGSGVEYLNLALTEQPGRVRFNVLRNADGRPRADGQASLLKRQDQLGNGFVEVEVEGTSLDAFFASHPYQSAALWVDVEGAAQQVLSGGRATLTKTSIVMIEVEDRQRWGDEHWLRKDTMSYLYDHGLIPVARDFQSRYQHNVVLIRHDLQNVDRVQWLLTRFASRESVGTRPSLLERSLKALGSRLENVVRR
jgi:FkbM family methyltransferase